MRQTDPDDGSRIGRSDKASPENDAAVNTLMGAYVSGRDLRGFDTGIQYALARVLVDPQFIFRFEHEPANLPDGAVYRVSDFELASRLSFFLWSSVPDDELLKVAGAGRLADPAVLEQQTRRMLADPRAQSLVHNVAGQWLLLRQLDDVSPSTKVFDGKLRQAFRRETELLFETILREDRSVVDLIDADYTFVDERLAKHYGIPNIRGSRFRRVTVDDDARRGLLGHGSLSDRHVGREPHVPGQARQVDTRKPPGRSGTASATWSGDQPGSEGHARRRAHLAAPTAGAAPGQSELRGVSRGHGPDWFRARKLRPDRPVAGC